MAYVAESPPSIDDVEIDCRKHHAEFILREFIRYIIIDKKDNKILGRCAFPSFQSNWHIPQFGIAYFIGKTQRKKGFAREAAHALTYLAFKILNAKKVKIYCDIENADSKNVLINLGFNLEYSEKGEWLKANGELATLNIYSMFSMDDLPEMPISL